MGWLAEFLRDLSDRIDGKPELTEREEREAAFRNLPVASRRGIIRVHEDGGGVGVTGKGWKGIRRTLTGAGSVVRNAATNNFTREIVLKVKITPSSSTARIRVRGSAFLSRDRRQGGILGVVIAKKVGNGNFQYSLISTYNLHTTDYNDWQTQPTFFDYDMEAGTTSELTFLLAGFLYNQPDGNKYNNGTFYWNRTAGYTPTPTFTVGNPATWLEVSELKDGVENITLQTTAARDSV